MPAKTKQLRPKTKMVSPESNAKAVLASLKQLANPRLREEMSSRYGIITPDAFGVRMSDMQGLAKKLGRNHALAQTLWATGNYEARTVAALVAEPAQVTPALMDRWCRDFDNWAICDTVCFKLFDQAPRAFERIEPWSRREGEFQKRAAFALLASLALHDKKAADELFRRCLPLIETAATDERNFVKKGVSWALRAIGTRGADLQRDAIALAQQLAATKDATSRWIGKDALRAFAKKG
jgi:3-methyladenine DNA glycosylase AlkD